MLYQLKMEKLEISEIEPFEVKDEAKVQDYLRKVAHFDDWEEVEEREINPWAIRVNEDEKEINPWAIRVNEDVERASWDYEDEEEEEEYSSFGHYGTRSPEPGDVTYEVAAALRMHHSKVENLTDARFKQRFFEVKALKEEERVETLTPRQRREEIENICAEISELKKGLQSSLDKINALGQRMAQLICRD